MLTYNQYCNTLLFFQIKNNSQCHEFDLHQAENTKLVFRDSVLLFGTINPKSKKTTLLKIHFATKTVLGIFVEYKLLIKSVTINPKIVLLILLENLLDGSQRHLDRAY